MIDFSVIGQAMERAEKISGQLVERLRQSMNELEAIRKDVQQARSVAGDAPGLGGTIAQLDRAFDQVAEPAEAVVKTLDQLQDSVRSIVKTVGDLEAQQADADDKARAAKEQAGQQVQSVQGVEGVQGVQGVRR